MLKNRLVLGAVALVLVSGCFASDDVEVIESSGNSQLVETLHLHEAVMLKLIHKTAKLEKELNELKNKISKQNTMKKENKVSSIGSSVTPSKYDKEFRAYIEASKKGQ